MNQEPSDDLSFYLGLQGFDVMSTELVADERHDVVKVVRIERHSGQHQCSECGKRHMRGLFDEFRPVRLRDCSLGDYPTFLEVRAKRVRCCGGTRVERLPFAAPDGFRMTQRFFHRVAALCTRLPVETVSSMAHLSWDTVAHVDKKAIEMALGRNDVKDMKLRWIGVDEVSRTGGHVYFTVVTDLKSGRVVWIGDGKGEKGFLPFVEALGRMGRNRIRVAVSDLGYKALIGRHLRHATPILDRFHIVQWMNQGLNAVRRRLFGGAPSDEVGRAMKVKKWMLLSARERLRGKDRALLDQLMEQNLPLYEAYLLKEQLRGLLRHPWRYLGVMRRRLEDWIETARNSGLSEIARVAKRLAPHIDSILAGHHFRVPLGLVEAINGKIATLRIQARGYTDPEYFKLKIFQRCSLPDNPWAKIVL